MTADASYAPGTWVAVSAPDAWLLVNLPPDDQIVRRCWSLLSSGAGIDDILDALLSNGVRALPPFALVRVADDERRAVARGSASILISAAGGTTDTKVFAAPGSAWADETFGTEVDVMVLAGDDAPVDSVELPMAACVTMASSIRIRARAEVQPAAVEAPSPVVEDAEPPPVPVDAEPASEQDEAPARSYDFLFGATERPPAVAEEPVTVAAAPEPPPSDATASWSTIGPEALDEPPPTAPDPMPPASSVIDAVPGLPPLPQPERGAAPVWQPPAVSAAPSWTPPSPASAESPATDVERTVSRAHLQDLTTSAPTVLAGRCPAGHLSPPHADRCRVCGAAMPPGQEGFEIARPPLGVLRLSTGDVVTLDRGVILGRAPEAPADIDERPHLVRLVSPENDVSRNHAEVVLDGWMVYVRDLDSTNGTVVTLPGQPPVRLRPHDLYLLENGAAVTLADEISFRFEVGE